MNHKTVKLINQFARARGFNEKILLKVCKASSAKELTLFKLEMRSYLEQRKYIEEVVGKPLDNVSPTGVDIPDASKIKFKPYRPATPALEKLL